MNIGKYHFVFILVTVACAGILLYSCNDENEFTLGDDFVESSTHLSIVDTFSVEMSTVIQDSVPTSATGAMLVGKYQDTVFGSISCISYCQIGLPSTISLGEDDIYDSIVLVLEYSKYFFGDTNSLAELSIHQLNESIELHDNGYL
ncbi:MAG: DUF4270 family protein, partial [Bacteroidales bacterium]|nr:DUF4270 family protein [Bacteroidales bacterium]